MQPSGTMDCGGIQARKILVCYQAALSRLWVAVRSACLSAVTEEWRAYSIVNSPLPCVMDRKPVLYPNMSFRGTCTAQPCTSGWDHGAVPSKHPGIALKLGYLFTTTIT